jgi:hypothetical protein
MRRWLEGVRNAAVEEGGNLRLVDAHDSRGSDLGRAPVLDGRTDMACKLGPWSAFLGLGETQVGEYVAVARGHRDFGFSLLDHLLVCNPIIDVLWRLSYCGFQRFIRQLEGNGGLASIVVGIGLAPSDPWPRTLAGVSSWWGRHR